MYLVDSPCLLAITCIQPNYNGPKIRFTLTWCRMTLITSCCEFKKHSHSLWRLLTPDVQSYNFKMLLRSNWTLTPCVLFSQMKTLLGNGLKVILHSKLSHMVCLCETTHTLEQRAKNAITLRSIAVYVTRICCDAIRLSHSYGCWFEQESNVVVVPTEIHSELHTHRHTHKGMLTYCLSIQVTGDRCFSLAFHFFNGII